MDWSIWLIKKNYNPNKEIGIITSILRSYLCDFSDAYIAVIENIIVTNPDGAKRSTAVAFKIMHHLSTAFQKMMA